MKKNIQTCTWSCGKLYFNKKLSIKNRVGADFPYPRDANSPTFCRTLTHFHWISPLLPHFTEIFRNIVFRVCTSLEIQKSRVFQGCFTIFSRALPGFLKPRMKITFTTNHLKQHLIVNVVTVKQQCAPSVSFQY